MPRSSTRPQGRRRRLKSRRRQHRRPRRRRRQPNFRLSRQRALRCHRLSSSRSNLPHCLPLNLLPRWTASSPPSTIPLGRPSLPTPLALPMSTTRLSKPLSMVHRLTREPGKDGSPRPVPELGHRPLLILPSLPPATKARDERQESTCSLLPRRSQPHPPLPMSPRRQPNRRVLPAGEPADDSLLRCDPPPPPRPSCPTVLSFLLFSFPFQHPYQSSRPVSQMCYQNFRPFDFV